ncbi:MAG: hypothetical protein QOJ59_1681 [Thermomicrobiales bacterium]|jgi:hypothetical protein|nr:hypothetical protein [Thermomicrobiales bacterium]
MKRTTFLLPDELATLLEMERRRRDVSAAAIVREALEAYFRKGDTIDSPRVPRIAALGRGGGNRVATQMEDLLAEEARSAAALKQMMYGADAVTGRGTDDDRTPADNAVEPFGDAEGIQAGAADTAAD